MYQHQTFVIFTAIVSMVLKTVAGAQNSTVSMPNKDYALYVASNKREPYNFTESEDIDVQNDITWASLVWIHDPAKYIHSFKTPSGRNLSALAETLFTLYLWLDAGATIATVNHEYKVRFDASKCAQYVCSPSKICNARYYCLMRVLLNLPLNPEFKLEDDYRLCLVEQFNISLEEEDASSWRCNILLSNNQFDSTGNGAVGYQRTNCEDLFFDLTPQNWAKLRVDENLQIALRGGIDTGGVFWEGQRVNESTAEAVGRQFWYLRGVKCTIRSPCQPTLDCSRIGSYTATRLGKSDTPMKLPWVLLASSAIKNLNQQLVNQYSELKDAIQSLALDTFSIGYFYRVEKQDFSVRESLPGLCGLFTVLGGFVPVIGPFAEITGTVASGVAGYLASSAASSNPFEIQGPFAEKVLAYYRGLLSGMEDIVAKIFEGKRIGNFNLTDIISDGRWVDPDSLTRVSDLNRKIRTEILARSIDSLWKTPPSNKIWVLFTHLQDDTEGTKCHEGTSLKE